MLKNKCITCNKLITEEDEYMYECDDCIAQQLQEHWHKCNKDGFCYTCYCL